MTAADTPLKTARLARDAWRELAKARGDLLACYRTGRQPSEKLHGRLDRAHELLRERGEL